MSIVLVPILGVFLGSFTPVPVIYQYYRRGRIFGLTMLGLAAVVVGLIYFSATQPYGSLVFLEYGVLAVALGEGLLRKWPPDKLVGLGAAAVMSVALVILATAGLSQGQSPWKFTRDMVETQVRASFGLYQSLVTGQTTLPGEQPAAVPTDPPPGPETGRDLPAPPPLAAGGLGEEFEAVAKVLIGIFPGLLIMGTLLVAWANFMVCRHLLARIGPLPRELTDLKRWRSPEQLVWVVIACGFGVFLPLDTINLLGWNGLLVLGLVYFFQGLCIVAYWMERKGAPPFVRVIIYTLIGLQQYLALVIAALGLFDMWFDFRKLKQAAVGS
jgi:uncharacterized protein YybS (DUF2232 family)